MTVLQTITNNVACCVILNLILINFPPIGGYKTAYEEYSVDSPAERQILLDNKNNKNNEGLRSEKSLGGF